MSTETVKKQRFDIADYDKRKDYCMLCNDEEAAREFLSYLNEVGRKWSNGSKYNPDDTRFGEYSGGTCYHFNRGLYGGIEYAEANDCHILYFDDFEWDSDIPITSKDVKKLDKFFAQFAIS